MILMWIKNQVQETVFDETSFSKSVVLLGHKVTETSWIVQFLCCYNSTFEINIDLIIVRTPHPQYGEYGSFEPISPNIINHHEDLTCLT